MGKTQAEIFQEKILNNKIDVKVMIEKQTQLFGKLLINKISDHYKYIDKQRLSELFSEMFFEIIKQELDNIIQQFATTEEEFYLKHFKTIEMIFKLNDKRTRIIYLDNVIKKISENNTEISESYFENINDESNLSINSIFDKFIQKVVKNPHLTIDESDELYMLAIHYFKNYKNDVINSLNNFIFINMSSAIEQIEKEIDNQDIRNGKSNAVCKIEKTITVNSLKVIEKMLEKTITKYKETSKIQLKACSAQVVDLIFRTLPEEYRDQRGLLEVIVDTNIQEKLGSQLDFESHNLSENLKAKNKDIIENELYEEKRYKKIDDYKCNLELILHNYESVLEEIRNAYDIPKSDLAFMKLYLLIKGEGVSTQIVFEKLINSISVENQKNLELVLKEMRKLSKKAFEEDQINKENNELKK